MLAWKIFRNEPSMYFILLQLNTLMSIGAKKGGTGEQCSQKLFELAEIFRKIIKFPYIIINLISNKKKTWIKLKSF